MVGKMGNSSSEAEAAGAVGFTVGGGAAHAAKMRLIRIRGK